MKYSELYRKLKPYIVADMRAIGTAGGVNTGGGGGGGLTSHELADTTGLGTYHTVSGLTVGQVLIATGATSAAFGSIDHDDLATVTPDQHHAQTHGILSGDHTGTGSTLDLIGFSATNTLGKLTPSSNPGAAAAILASSAAGDLTLVTLAATTKVTTPTVATASGALALSPNSGTVNLPASGVLGTASGGYTLAPTTDITLDPAGDDVLIASATRLGSDNYASQTTGWRIDYAGAGDFRYLFTDELHAKSFIADLEQALAGGQIIPKSVAMLSRAFALPAAGAAATLYLRDLPSAENMAVFESGDTVRLRTFSRAAGSLTIADAWGVVTSYSDLADKEQSWTFTRSSAPNAGTATGTIAADSLALDYGVSGNGWHETNAIDGLYGINSPYSQVATWTTHPATGSAVRVRTGNLRGITGSTEYGLWAGVTTAQNLLVTGDKIALRQGTTEKITLESDGDSYFSGVMTIGTSGEIRQGTVTSGDVGSSLTGFTGLRLWRDTNVGRIGGYNLGTLQWYGSTDGRLYGGAGAVYMDAVGLGMTVNPATSVANDKAVTWRASGPTGAVAARVGAYTNGGVAAISMQADATGTSFATLDSNGNFTVNNKFVVSGTTYAMVDTMNLGVGLQYGVDTPAARLHVHGTSPTIRLSGASANQTLTLAFYDANTTLEGRLLYAGGNASPNKYFGFVNDGGDYLGFFSHVFKFTATDNTAPAHMDLYSNNAGYGPYLSLAHGGTSGRTWELRSSGTSEQTETFQIIDRSAPAARFTIDKNGNVGIGTSTPGDKLEVNGNARMIDAELTGNLMLEATGGVITFMDRGTDPPAPSTADRALMYMRDNKLFIVYRDTGDSVTRYRYLDLESTDGLWTQTTTQPAGG